MPEAVDGVFPTPASTTTPPSVRAGFSRSKGGELVVGGQLVFRSSTSLNDPKAVAADAKTARLTVIPFHQHLELIRVPDDPCAWDPQIGLLDPVTSCRDGVSPLQAAPPSQ